MLKSTSYSVLPFKVMRPCNIISDAFAHQILLNFNQAFFISFSYDVFYHFQIFLCKTCCDCLCNYQLHVLVGHSITAATASIPSQYQTIVIDNSDKKGFLSKARRFQYESDSVSFVTSH